MWDYVQSIENTMLAGGPFPEPFINCLFVDTCSTVALTGFSTKTCFQRKKLKYNNRLIMFTDILKMCFFFRLCSFSGPITRNFLRSKSTNFMTQVNNCMFIFSEIKCNFQSKVVKFVTKINSVKVIFKNYLVFSLYLWGTQWLLLE